MVGIGLYSIAKALLVIKDKQEAEPWTDRFIGWIKIGFLSEMSIDEHGNTRPTHEKLLKAERSLLKLISEKYYFHIP